MIAFLQKKFHTDRWWGKTLFIVLVYVIFWCVFFGGLLLIPNEYFEGNNVSSYPVLFYVFAFVPLISFFVPPFIKKMFHFNNIGLYTLHIFLIVLSLFIFVQIVFAIAWSNFSIG